MRKLSNLEIQQRAENAVYHACIEKFNEKTKTFSQVEKRFGIRKILQKC